MNTIFQAINQLPDSLSPIFYFFSLGIKGWPLRLALVALVVGMVKKGGTPRTVILQSLIGVGLANLTCDVLKKASFSPRPCSILPSVLTHHQECLTSSGTASAHSANMAAVAIIFALGLRWWGIPWALVAIVTGFSRMYFGYHSFEQVLLGWAVGLIVGAILVLVWGRVRILLSKNDGRKDQDPQTSSVGDAVGGDS